MVSWFKGNVWDGDCYGYGDGDSGEQWWVRIDLSEMSGEGLSTGAVFRGVEDNVGSADII